MFLDFYFFITGRRLFLTHWAISPPHLPFLMQHLIDMYHFNGNHCSDHIIHTTTCPLLYHLNLYPDISPFHISHFLQLTSRFKFNTDLETPRRRSLSCFPGSHHSGNSTLFWQSFNLSSSCGWTNTWFLTLRSRSILWRHLLARSSEMDSIWKSRGGFWAEKGRNKHYKSFHCIEYGVQASINHILMLDTIQSLPDIKLQSTGDYN